MDYDDGYTPYQVQRVREAVSEALGKYGELFDAGEKAVLNKFMCLNSDAQLMVSRLYGRKKIWVRLEKANNEKVADPKTAMHDLAEGNFIDVYTGDSVKWREPPRDLVAVLTAADIKDILKKCGVPGVLTMHKEALFTYLCRLLTDTPQKSGQQRLSFVNGPSKATLTARKLTSSALGSCMKITVAFHAIFRQAHHLYLLQSPSDAVEMLLVETTDTGNGHPSMALYTMKKWPVARDRDTAPVFRTKSKYTQYTEAMEQLHKVSAAGIAVQKSKDKDACMNVVKPVAEMVAKALAKHAEGAKEKERDVEIKDEAAKVANENCIVLDDEDAAVVRCEVDLTSDAKSVQSDNGSLFSFESEAPESDTKPAEPLPVEYTTNGVCNGCGSDHTTLTAPSNIFRAAHVHRLTLVDAIGYLESSKEYTLAVTYLKLILACPLFKPRRRGRLWQRLVINSTHLKQKDAAAKYLKQALTEEESYFMAGSDRLWLERRYRKIEKEATIEHPRNSFSIHVTTPTIRYVTGKKWRGSKWPMWDLSSSTVVEDENDFGGLSVESFAEKPPSLGNVERAAKHAICRHLTEGWNGTHCEGGTLRFIFTLLTWEVLFSNFVDNMPARFVSMPMDFSSPFFEARKGLFEERCAEIRTWTHETLACTIKEQYEQHNGVTAFNCDWSIECAVVLQVAVCLGPVRSAGLCFEFATQMQLSGMPDLLLWNPITQDILISEVKGPGDFLSTKQEIWLTRLAELGIPAEVCRVADVEAMHAKNQKRLSVEQKRLSTGSGKTAKRQRKSK